MQRIQRSGRLIVALNGRLVGTLDRATTGAISFTYAAEWLADQDHAVPVSLSLPLRAEPHLGSQVLAFFDNLLPDNAQIRRKVAEKFGAGGTDAFNLLAKIGRDCVGALQFLSEDEEIVPPGPAEYLQLTDADVADIIRNLATTPLGAQPSGKKELRVSIAGFQEKTALLWHNGWCLPKGPTPTTHILKPALGKLANGLDLTLSVENEHFCLTLCRELGLDVAQSRIVDVEDVRILAVERFDRLRMHDEQWLRIPQEDFCQALSVPWTQKYADDGGPGVRECLGLLDGSDYPEQDMLSFLRAQVAFWLIGATDGHAKNFSIFLTPKGQYRMTPLYDIISLQPNQANKELASEELCLAMGIGGSQHNCIENILPKHFLQDAKAADMQQSDVEELFAELAEMAESAVERAWANMPKDFPQHIAEPISDAVRTRSARLCP